MHTKTKNKFFASMIILMVILSASELKMAHALDASSAPKLTTPKISVQLWSVREDVAADFKASIGKIAEMGFEGVELAGDLGEFKDNPTALAEFIESKGMKISGAHVNYDALSSENFDQTINYYKAAGAPTLIIPYDPRMGKNDQVDEAIAQLNELHKKVSAHGFRFGYHNHGFEFEENPQTGETFWDQLAQSTPASFVLQLDVGWVNFAGKDPISFVERYPGKTLSTHYKATLHPSTTDKLPIIGQDTIDWARLYDANRTSGGTQWLVVEQEEYPQGFSPMQAVHMSKQGLDRILREHKPAK